MGAGALASAVTRAGPRSSRRMSFMRTHRLHALAAALLVLAACAPAEETGDEFDDWFGSVIDTGATFDVGPGSPGLGTRPDSGVPPDTATDAGGRANATQEGCAERPLFATYCAPIEEDTSWVNDGQTILLEGVVVVDGATLTIEPGVTILGNPTDGVDALVITRSGTLDAQGTAEAPIVFGSTNEADARPGDFGGIMLLGDASVQGIQARIEGLDAELSAYGGTRETSSCGTLRYVRIETAGGSFAGTASSALTLAGCGTSTTLEYIQADRTLGDGISFFGGSGALRFAIVTDPGDDGLTWERGYRGRIQNLLVARAGDNGIEGENGASPDAPPRSQPTLWNLTLDCAGGSRAMTLGSGTAASLNSAILSGCALEPFNIRDPVTVEQIEADDLSLRYIIAFNNAAFQNESDAGDAIDDDGGFIEADWFVPDTIRGLSTEDPMLDATWVPASTSPATNGVRPDSPFDSTQTQIGAFPATPTTWATPWSTL